MPFGNALNVQIIHQEKDTQALAMQTSGITLKYVQYLISSLEPHFFNT